MISFFRWLFGYVKFSFSKGFREGFLNDCFSEGIEIRNVELYDNGFTAYCNVKKYKSLHRIALAHGGIIKVQQKKGLPFILLPLKNRLGFFSGMIAFIMIISFLSSFIWEVEITGCSRLSQSVIETYLENNNFKSGTMWSSVDRDDMCWQLMSAFDDIAWVHINKFGAKARVEINETTQNTEADEDKLKGIDIFRREIQTVAYREQKNISIKDSRNYNKLVFFSAEIPLYFNKTSGDISELSEKYLKIKDVTLPIGIETSTEKYLISSSQTLSDDEVKALARKKLTYAEREELEDFEIINKNEEIQLDDDKCVISASYIVRRK